MKVAVTGHTKGIGLALSQYFERSGHQVIGLSRSNGYALPAEEERALKAILPCDVFVNNAYQGAAQITLLQKAAIAWRDQSGKQIFNLGSVSSELVRSNDPLYSSYKKALDKMAHLMQSGTIWPLIHNLRPGMIDTDLTATRRDVAKMTTAHVVEIVDWILRCPRPIYIQEITFKHLEQILRLN
jgi:NAD(P)-dependent dehydrogenase (short-subunit alcohol dehydrogenase family)